MLKYFSSIFLFFQISFAQNIFFGKVVTQYKSNSILIVNFTTKLSTQTTENGDFNIAANSGDLIIISSKEIESIEIKITQQILNKKPFYIFLKNKSIELETIEISKITPKSVGINTKQIAALSYSERKYRDFAKGNSGIDIQYLLVQGYQLLFANKIKEQKRLNILKSSFSEICTNDYIKDTLKIPFNLVNNFETTALKNPNIVEAIQSKNKKVVYFLVNDLAKNYMYETK